MSTIRISGSHGSIEVRAIDGVVLSADEGKYSDIKAIDISRYMNDYEVGQLTNLPEEIDILCVGYWRNDGTYEEPISKDQIRK